MSPPCCMKSSFLWCYWTSSFSQAHPSVKQCVHWCVLLFPLVLSWWDLGFSTDCVIILLSYYPLVLSFWCVCQTRNVKDITSCVSQDVSHLPNSMYCIQTRYCKNSCICYINNISQYCACAAYTDRRQIHASIHGMRASWMVWRGWKLCKCYGLHSHLISTHLNVNGSF